MNCLYQKFKNYIKEEKLLSRNEASKIVIGLSGGADSVSLLLLFNELKKEFNLEIFAVHINHNLRGKDALEDQKFAERLCSKLKINFKVYSEDVKGLSEKEGLSLEEAGRKIRYERFKEEALKNNAKIAVAHHAQDNAETIIFNMIRGAGLEGIKGMQPKKELNGVEIIRPLLFAERKEIEEYLKEMGQNFRTDETNQSLDYSRNKIRHVILKEMMEINPEAISHLNRLSKSVKEADEILKERTDALKEKIVSVKEENVFLASEILKGLSDFEKKRVVYEALTDFAKAKKDITETHVKEILRLLTLGNGKRVSLPYGIEAVNENKKIVLKKIKEKGAPILKEINLKDNPQTISAKGKTFTFETVLVDDSNREKLIEKNECTKAFDYDKMSDSFFLRTRKEKDIITIKNGEKSLSRFFIDSKIPKDERDEILLFAKENEVIWIVGFRISEKFKITENTKKALIVSVTGESNG